MPVVITIARTHACISEFFMGFPIFRPPGGADVGGYMPPSPGGRFSGPFCRDRKKGAPREDSRNMTEDRAGDEKSPVMRTFLCLHVSLVSGWTTSSRPGPRMRVSAPPACQGSACCLECLR